jgi:hypothetical protein
MKSCYINICPWLLTTALPLPLLYFSNDSGILPRERELMVRCRVYDPCQCAEPTCRSAPTRRRQAPIAWSFDNTSASATLPWTHAGQTVVAGPTPPDCLISSSLCSSSSSILIPRHTEHRRRQRASIPSLSLAPVPFLHLTLGASTTSQRPCSTSRRLHPTSPANDSPATTTCHVKRKEEQF